MKKSSIQDINYLLEELSQSQRGGENKELEQIVCDMLNETDMVAEDMTQEFLISCLKKKMFPILKNYEYMKNNYKKILDQYAE